MILQGNCADLLKDINDNSIDLLLTDPPYGIEFMGKDWDKVVVSKEIWKECYRVLKQGKLAFIMCSPRQDVLSRMIVNLQDAGFRTNYTSIYWTYASGFPKAANLKDGSYVGFQPKPAVEVILVVSKGKTLTWLDDCRIPYQSEDDRDATKIGYKTVLSPEKGWNNNHMDNPISKMDLKGRFPANLLVEDDILNDGKSWRGAVDNHKASSIYGNEMKDKAKGWGREEFGSYSRYFSLDAWAQKTFPLLIVPKASKSERNEGCEDFEGTVRFASKPESGKELPTRDAESHVIKGNHHPTIKPLKLMSYLITLGSREGDLILDPFCGSGTTLLAAHQLHRKYLGIELNPEYITLAKERLAPMQSQLKMELWNEA